MVCERQRAVIKSLATTQFQPTAEDRTEAHAGRKMDPEVDVVMGRAVAPVLDGGRELADPACGRHEVGRQVGQQLDLRRRHRDEHRQNPLPSANREPSGECLPASWLPAGVVWPGVTVTDVAPQHTRRSERCSQA